MTIDKKQLIYNMKLSGYIETSDLDNISEEKLELLSKFAPMIASMVYKNIDREIDNENGKEIFDNLMQQDIKDPNTKKKLELISNFAPMIASMVYRYESDQDNYTGKDIFDQLMSLDKEKLELISKFAPMIPSMVYRYESDQDNKAGKDIFDSLMEHDINDQNIKKKLELVSNFAPMIASMVDRSGDSHIGKEIFDELMTLDNEKLNLLSNFAPIIASMVYRSGNSHIGKKIFDFLIDQDINDQNIKEKLELVSKFAPMIASMVYKNIDGESNIFGKEIFDKLMSLDTQKLTEINNSYDECKGDNQEECHNEIIKQIRNAYEKINNSESTEEINNA